MGTDLNIRPKQESDAAVNKVSLVCIQSEAEKEDSIINTYSDGDATNNTCNSFEQKPQRRSNRITKKGFKYSVIVNQSILYECLNCSETFPGLGKLKAHAKTHRKKHICSVCGEVCPTAVCLVNHKRTHGNFKPFKCAECSATFRQSSHLSIHKRSHTGEKPYTCDICSTRFKQISHLKTHVRIHTQDKPYRCDHCSSSFTQNSSLKRHSRTHTGEKPYKCSICSMAFVVKSNMKRHVNTHIGTKPFSCSLCGSAFAQSIDLKRHKISHTGIKPFRCDLCDAAFSRNNNLSWHRRTHFSNFANICAICHISLNTLSDLKAHMRVHASPKPFNCDSCSSSFSKLELLERHKVMHVDGQSSKTNLRANKKGTRKRKKFECSRCSSNFFDGRSLKRHMIAIHKLDLGVTKGKETKDSSEDVDDPDDPLSIDMGEKHHQNEVENSRCAVNAGVVQMTDQNIALDNSPQVSDHSEASDNGITQQRSVQDGSLISGDDTNHSNPAGENLVGPDAAVVNVVNNNVISGQPLNIQFINAQQMNSQVFSAPGYSQLINGQPLFGQQPLILQSLALPQSVDGIPQIMMLGPGQVPRIAKPAGSCTNHSSHVITCIDGPPSQSQVWCFCDPTEPSETSSVIPQTTAVYETDTSANAVSFATGSMAVSALTGPAYIAHHNAVDTSFVANTSAVAGPTFIIPTATPISCSTPSVASGNGELAKGPPLVYQFT